MSQDEKLREGINNYLRAAGTTQLELANRTQMAPQYISDFLNMRRGKLPKSLIRILDALGLELVVRPKN